MSVYENIISRRSIRKFKDIKLSDDAIQKLIMAGMSAPSAMNSQPWEFLVIKNSERLRQISDICQYWNFLKSAAAAIVVLANLENYKAVTVDYFVQDCSACTQNILLTANALQIGSTWLGLYPNTTKILKFREQINIPEKVKPFSIIALGYPDEFKKPHDDFQMNRIHYEQY